MSGGSIVTILSTQNAIISASRSHSRIGSSNAPSSFLQPTPKKPIMPTYGQKKIVKLQNNQTREEIYSDGQLIFAVTRDAQHHDLEICHFRYPEIYETLRYDEKGKLHGEYSLAKTNGEILKKGMYQHGNPEGRWMLHPWALAYAEDNPPLKVLPDCREIYYRNGNPTTVKDYKFKKNPKTGEKTLYLYAVDGVTRSETVHRNANKIKKGGRGALAVMKGLRSIGLLKTDKKRGKGL